ncbi:RNA polymerase sigma-70 factor (ECF subfamily) [Oikeobacillus pervagus]|uniref:RNA polymerase sigma-70 factor (ECF subfamily) n=1 Tax=Oikeobacillus pervagus TaxID=1325931 RepID=A0AAJ1WHE5_9BACI|nr:sigma-70 family RNA polymerase sigma factor [Oikeobacillus pervagus]MDQ0216107.1 RNA polymerase sigma-70 factor (ECF subfamily) [Oikeobacillus pervagus]
MEEIFSEAVEADDRDLLLDQIMTEYGQGILELVYSYVKNQMVAEDLTQEIFVKCYRSLHTFEKKSNIKTWLWRIAINHCKDYLKSWHYRNIEMMDADDMTFVLREEDVAVQVVKQDEKQIIMQAILQLPVKYRELIYFHYYEDLSFKEIEQITSVKQNTIKTRIRRAKELLKEQLGEE